MGVSIFEKLLDKLHLSFLYRGGDKKTTNLAAGRDINTMMIVFDKDKSNSPDLIVSKAQKLLAKKGKSTKASLNIVLGTFIGIVKSAEKPGTRVQLEFAVMNKAAKPTVLQAAYIKINDGVVHFKKFYKSNSNGSRVFDLSSSFPIIINSNGATKLQIEFENIKQTLIDKGKNEGEIFVLAENNTLSSRKFSLPVNNAMIEILKQSQDSADKTGIPSILPATIQS